MSVKNPSYVAVGFSDLSLDVWHHCCDTPIAHVTNPDAVTIGARDSQIVEIDVNMDTAQWPDSAACAAEYIATGKCHLIFNGTVSPMYIATTFPDIPIQWEQDIS
jgi:hypothetical protein